MEEERRLCYVGVTRAQKHLYLLHTFRRTLYGESAVREPSRFIHDVPQHLVKGREGEARQPARQQSLGMGAGRFYGRPGTRVSRARPAREVRPADEPSPAVTVRFQTGDEVQHDVFGKGVVIESELVGCLLYTSDAADELRSV